MSFVNFARTGFENMNQFGKLIGTGKNNGIKVFEKLESDGRRVLTSLDKEGTPIKEVVTESSFSTFKTNTKNFKTGVTTNSHHLLENEGSEYIYKFEKTTPLADKAGSIKDTFELKRTSDKFDNGFTELKDVRRDFKEEFQNKSNVQEVRVTQTLLSPNKSPSLVFEAFPKEGIYKIQTKNDFKITEDIILPNGKSQYGTYRTGVGHKNGYNVHELNIVKSLIEGLQKIWL